MSVPDTITVDQALALISSLYDEIAARGDHNTSPIDLAGIFAFLADDMARAELQAEIKRADDASHAT